MSCFPQFRSYNPAFTRLEIWFRFVFLLSTFIVTVSEIFVPVKVILFMETIYICIFSVLVFPLHEKVFCRQLVTGTEVDVSFDAAAYSL